MPDDGAVIQPPEPVRDCLLLPEQPANNNANAITLTVFFTLLPFIRHSDEAKNTENTHKPKGVYLTFTFYVIHSIV